jgi:predicted transcriptional regulator
VTASRATSYRLDPAIKARLEEQAAQERIAERTLLERLISEGLDILHHPGVVYRAGPTGRRAALAVGPDVWEVVSALRYTEGSEEQRVTALAEQFGLHPRHVRTAIDFAAAHRDEIDAQVRSNDEAARRAQRMAEARADLMAS